MNKNIKSGSLILWYKRLFCYDPQWILLASADGWLYAPPTRRSHCNKEQPVRLALKVPRWYLLCVVRAGGGGSARNWVVIGFAGPRKGGPTARSEPTVRACSCVHVLMIPLACMSPNRTTHTHTHTHTNIWPEVCVPVRSVVGTRAQILRSCSFIFFLRVQIVLWSVWLYS